MRIRFIMERQVDVTDKSEDGIFIDAIAYVFKEEPSRYHRILAEYVEDGTAYKEPKTSAIIEIIHN